MKHNKPLRFGTISKTAPTVDVKSSEFLALKEEMARKIPNNNNNNQTTMVAPNQHPPTTTINNRLIKKKNAMETIKEQQEIMKQQKNFSQQQQQTEEKKSFRTFLHDQIKLNKPSQIRRTQSFTPPPPQQPPTLSIPQPSPIQIPSNSEVITSSTTTNLPNQLNQRPKQLTQQSTQPLTLNLNHVDAIRNDEEEEYISNLLITAPVLNSVEFMNQIKNKILIDKQLCSTISEDLLTAMIRAITQEINCVGSLFMGPLLSLTSKQVLAIRSLKTKPDIQKKLIESVIHATVQTAFEQARLPIPMNLSLFLSNELSMIANHPLLLHSHHNKNSSK